MVKNLTANAGDQETQVQFLGWEDPLEEEMATIPVFLPGEFLDRGAWWDTVHGGHKELDTTDHTLYILAANSFLQPKENLWLGFVALLSWQSNFLYPMLT